MTNPTYDPDSPHLAVKRVRARQLTDPLGAKGFRATKTRVNGERRSRTIALLTSLGAFAGVVGAIAWDSPANTTVSQVSAAVPSAQRSTDITKFQHASTSTKTVKATHVRTRSS